MLRYEDVSSARVLRTRGTRVLYVSDRAGPNRIPLSYRRTITQSTSIPPNPSANSHGQSGW